RRAPEIELGAPAPGLRGRPARRGARSGMSPTSGIAVLPSPPEAAEMRLDADPIRQSSARLQELATRPWLARSKTCSRTPRRLGASGPAGEIRNVRAA